MDRRAFVGSVAWGLPAASLNAGAQKTAEVSRIGLSANGLPLTPSSWRSARRCANSGYIEGQNVVVEFRSTNGSLDLAPQIARELVRMPVDARGVSAQHTMAVSTTLPIVFTLVG